VSDRDFSAIATWDKEPKDAPSGGGIPYVCVDCEWTGGTLAAGQHHYETGHAVRGNGWPTYLGNAQFSDAGPDGRRREQKSA
jgi:hypothetical protein